MVQTAPLIQIPFWLGLLGQLIFIVFGTVLLYGILRALKANYKPLWLAAAFSVLLMIVNNIFNFLLPGIIGMVAIPIIIAIFFLIFRKAYKLSNKNAAITAASWVIIADIFTVILLFGILFVAVSGQALGGQYTQTCPTGHAYGIIPPEGWQKQELVMPVEDVGEGIFVSFYPEGYQPGIEAPSLSVGCPLSADEGLEEHIEIVKTVNETYWRSPITISERSYFINGKPAVEIVYSTMGALDSEPTYRKARNIFVDTGDGWAIYITYSAPSDEDYAKYEAVADESIATFNITKP